jgi:hypothetical protein
MFCPSADLPIPVIIHGDIPTPNIVFTILFTSEESLGPPRRSQEFANMTPETGLKNMSKMIHKPLVPLSPVY